MHIKKNTIGCKKIKVTIHQPEHLPWLGFFHKLSLSDIFVILDNVQYRKNYYQNRNKIRTDQGFMWITVPVERHLKTLIKDVKIVQDKRWKKKWWDSIRCTYNKASYFNNYAEKLHDIINKEEDKLINLNIEIIRFICGILNIKCQFIKASELSVKGKREILLLNCCKELNAGTYISGVSGREYLEVEKFKNEGIKIIFQEFYHPIYEQLHNPFKPCMSVIDLILNYGPKSSAILMGKNVEVMEDIFY